MAKLWLLSWTLAMPTPPVLELSLRVGSPLFHVIHQLESAVSDWFVFSLLFFICCGLLFFFFPQKKSCVCSVLARGALLLSIKMNSSKPQLISEPSVLSIFEKYATSVKTTLSLS